MQKINKTYSVDSMIAILNRVISGESIRSVSLDTGVDRNTIKKYLIKSHLQKAKAATPHPAEESSVRVSSPVVISHVKPRQSIVLAIPDMHHPFCHQDALYFLRAVKARYQPNKFVCLGDEVDFASFSRFIPDPDGMTPGGELARAIDSLLPFYLEFPEMMVCESNHTVRPMKKMFEAGLPASFLPTYSKMLNAPDGWQWQHHWIVDGVRYHHGDAGKSGQFAPAQYMKAFKQSHVHGHLHGFACVMYEGAHFGMNTGCLIDAQAYAFKYAKNVAIPVNLGCGLIVDGKAAYFIPMHLDQNHRWTGQL